MRFVRDLRLIPAVALAAAALFVLKTSAIVIEGGYTLIASRVAKAQGLGQGPIVELPPPAALEETRGTPRGVRENATPTDESRSWVRDIYAPAEDITGSVAAPPKPEPPKEPAALPPGAPDKGKAPPAQAGPPPTQLDVMRPTLSAGERAVLESLQQRRQELEARAREIEVRDSLLKATEKRIEQRMQELKEMEARLTGAATKKDEAEAAKFKSLVSMYENMKAKDAAKIFDRLNMKILVEVVNQMNPRRMSDILGQMTPEAAERLTVELAAKSGTVEKAAAPVELPKIEGRPRS